MRRSITALVLALAALACAETRPARCDVAEPPGPPADVTTVCAHLLDLGCRIDEVPMQPHTEECSAAYAAQEAKLAPTDFARVTTCYAQAGSCAEVSSCSRACVPPPVADAGADAGSDAGADVGP